MKKMLQSIKQTVVSDNSKICASGCVRTRFFYCVFFNYRIDWTVNSLYLCKSVRLTDEYFPKFHVHMLYYLLYFVQYHVIYDMILYTSVILHFYLHINSIWYWGWISSVDIHFLRNCTYKVSISLTCKNIYMIFCQEQMKNRFV